MNNTFLFCFISPSPFPPSSSPPALKKPRSPVSVLKYRNWTIVFMFTERLISDWTCSSRRVWERKSTHQTFLGLSPFKDEKKIFSGIRLVSPPLFYLEGIGMGHFFSMTRITGFVRHRIWKKKKFFDPPSMASFSLLSTFFFASVLLFTCYIWY